MFLLLRKDNAIIVKKIVKSEVDFRVLHSNDKTNLVLHLQDTGTREDIFCENLSAILSVLSSPL